MYQGDNHTGPLVANPAADVKMARGGPPYRQQVARFPNIHTYTYRLRLALSVSALLLPPPRIRITMVAAVARHS